MKAGRFWEPSSTESSCNLKRLLSLACVYVFKSMYVLMLRNKLLLYNKLSILSENKKVVPINHSTV